MSKVEKNTDELIGELCSDLDIAKPRCPYRRIAVWLIGAIAYLTLVVAYIGIRPDFDMQLMKSSFLFEISIAVLILISASLASSWLSFPDCFQRHWVKIIPVLLFVVFCIWTVVRSLEDGMKFTDGLHLVHCAREGIMMEIIPLIALVFITMKGHTTQPYWSMAMNVLAVSTLGWIGLRLTCSVDEMGHSLFNHLLPFAILAAALGLFARKLFKW